MNVAVENEIYEESAVEIPDDGNEWHVAGEMEALKDGSTTD